MRLGFSMTLCLGGEELNQDVALVTLTRDLLAVRDTI